MYVPYISDASVWETSATPPVNVEKYLLDVCHCPGKDGRGVLAVIAKQVERLGVTLADAVSGTGDGGGENEGCAGVHAILEDRNPSYVRRRCLGHLSWRSADAGLDAMGVHYKDVCSLCTYLHEGLTWRRLQAIATQPVDAGGLALLREGSAEFQKCFSKAPGTILDARPETAAHFLAWLVPKEAILAQVVAKDVADRSLGDAAKAGLKTLQDPLGQVRRAIHCELLERSLFLFRWGKSHSLISASTTLPDLLDRCMVMIGSLAVDDHCLTRLGVTRANLVDKG